RRPAIRRIRSTGTLCVNGYAAHQRLHSFPTRRSSDLGTVTDIEPQGTSVRVTMTVPDEVTLPEDVSAYVMSPAIISERYVELGRSEEHTSELQSRENLVCRLLLEKKKQA